MRHAAHGTWSLQFPEGAHFHVHPTFDTLDPEWCQVSAAMWNEYQTVYPVHFIKTSLFIDSQWRARFYQSEQTIHSESAVDFAAGTRIFHVDPRLHPFDKGWNQELTRKFPPLWTWKSTPIESASGSWLMYHDLSWVINHSIFALVVLCRTVCPTVYRAIKCFIDCFIDCWLASLQHRLNTSLLRWPRIVPMIYIL